NKFIFDETSLTHLINELLCLIIAQLMRNLHHILIRNFYTPAFGSLLPKVSSLFGNFSLLSFSELPNARLSLVGYHIINPVGIQIDLTSGNNLHLIPDRSEEHTSELQSRFDIVS